MRKVSFSISQALFSAVLLLFVFTLLNGYVQNIVAGFRANPWLVLGSDILELAIVFWIGRNRVVVELDPLELAGWLLVVVGTWLYFVVPSLPTLLPPTQSSDAVRVYQQVLFSYPQGKLITWYPAGGAFLAAMFSHWLGWAPLRVLHLTAASFVALSAGAVYGITCALLPRTRRSKIAALLAPALLFVPWSYFAGIIDGEQYFFAQALAQLFVLAALWYTASYAAQPRWILAALVGAALLGTVAAYPIFVALSLATFALVVAVQVVWTKNRAAVLALAAFVGLLVISALALQAAGILEFAAGQVSATSEVGPGGVTNPSLENLGGPVMVLLALVGVYLACKQNAVGRVLIGFLLIWFAQFVALLVLQPFLQLSGYRVDKTFYTLIFPLAILAALPLAFASRRFAPRIQVVGRSAVAGLVGAVALLGLGVAVFRPPEFFSPFTESELDTALWAKEHLDTYQISYIDPAIIRAYWLAFGLWDETLPNEWFQWIPAGTKLGPSTFDEWLRDPAWPRWLFVRDADSQPIAPAQVIYRNGASAVVQKDVPIVAPPQPQHVSQWVFASAYGQVIRLLGYDLPRTTFQPGETVTFTTTVESINPPLVTAGWRAEILDREGKVVSSTTAEPFARYPVQRWPPGQFAQQAWALPLASSLAPGSYGVQLGLYGRVDGKEFSPLYTDPATGAVVLNKKPPEAVLLTTLKISVPRPTGDELHAATRLDTRVGDNVLLSSYALTSDAAARSVHLTLYWQDLSKMSNDYTVFVHLLDSGGKLIAQKDAPPLDGNYPTSIWDPGEIVKEGYDLAIPADARGPFSVEIGMYSPSDFERLPVGDSNHILLSGVVQ